jgi:hypothetical protein
MYVSGTAVASVASFSRLCCARVGSLLVIYIMTWLIMYDSHRLQISNELDEVLLEVRLHRVRC